MKQTPLILSILALVAVAALGIIQLTGNSNGKKKTVTSEAVEPTAKEGAIVWFDLDRVIDEYDLANDLRSVVETKVQSIQQEINRTLTAMQRSDTEYNAITSYGMLHVIYRLNLFGGGNGMFGGGPGQGGPGGRGGRGGFGGGGR